MIVFFASNPAMMDIRNCKTGYVCIADNTLLGIA